MRLNEARELIEVQEFSLQDTARAVEYSDPNYFSTSF
jgi:AraC-like DNA-binding protein